jgi:putative oxygen-independent coproporphyrinogen III oxidase
MTKYGLNEGLKASPALSLYVHLPWCIRKCPYCDFNSHERSAAAVLDFAPSENRYLDALEIDCDLSAPLVWGRTVESVFIGGGTPSLFSAAAIDRLLTILRSRFQLRPQCEITLEANPGTFEALRYEGFAKAGVNRLSIGVQSFSDEALTRLGRVHSAQQALDAIQVARRCFDSFNIDLMYGLPNQSLEDLSLEVRLALAQEPPHLSYYQLTLEANTLFAKYPPTLPDEDHISDMQDQIETMTQAQGLEHYEVSAYALPGKRCKHNVNYWQFGDYLGLGAGAHGKLSFHDRILRQQKFRKPEDYMARLLGTPFDSSNRPGATGSIPIHLVSEPKIDSSHPAIELERILQADDLCFEYFLNTLRLREGVPSAMFQERTGLSITRIQAALAEATKKGLLSENPLKHEPTALGFQYLNDLQMLFLA